VVARRPTAPAAQTAAGAEFLGTLNRLCLLPALGSVNTSDSVPAYMRDPSTVPPREAWYADPAQVFDNLYFVGGKLHSAWVLQVSAGYILLDTIYPYNSEELILGGMQRLALNPREIRYAVISHAHGDHIGVCHASARRLLAVVSRRYCRLRSGRMRLWQLRIAQPQSAGGPMRLSTSTSSTSQTAGAITAVGRSATRASSEPLPAGMHKNADDPQRHCETPVPLVCIS
jgi:hypothetical protein